MLLLLLAALVLLPALLLLLLAAVSLASLVAAAGAAAVSTTGVTGHFIFKVAILIGDRAGAKVDERGRRHRGLYDDRANSPSTHSAS